MGGLILGIIVGIIICAIIILVGGSIYGNLYEDWQEILCVIMIIILCSATMLGIVSATYSYEKLQSTCYIEKYITLKETIEESIHSKNISGAERLQLVQNAISQNVYLKKQQFDCKQWYGFIIDKNVLKLEPIGFD